MSFLLSVVAAVGLLFGQAGDAATAIPLHPDRHTIFNPDADLDTSRFVWLPPSPGCSEDCGTDD